MNLREGKQVVFEWDGTKKIGTIERVSTENKVKRYHIRDEGGRLYPGIGTMTPVPGRVLVKLTKKYFEAKEAEALAAKEASVAETIEAVNDGNEIFDTKNVSED